MGIQISKKRASNSYIGTFHFNDESDMTELASLKTMVRNMNKMVKSAGYDYAYRVKLQGRGDNRLERTRAYYDKKYDGQLPDKLIKSTSAQSLPLECAEYVDAYIYERT